MPLIYILTCNAKHNPQGAAQVASMKTPKTSRRLLVGVDVIVVRFLSIFSLFLFLCLVFGLVVGHFLYNRIWPMSPQRIDVFYESMNIQQERKRYYEGLKSDHCDFASCDRCQGEDDA